MTLLAFAQVVGVDGEVGDVTAADERLLRLYLADCSRRNLSPATRREYEGVLVRFCARGSGLKEATRAEVEAFLAAASLGPRSQLSYLAVLRAFYRWAVDAEQLAADPTRSVRPPRVGRRLPRPIPVGDLTLALSEASPVVRCWLTLGAYAGLRCQEMAGLDRDDVLEEVPAIRVRAGKGGKERYVPMHPVVAEALRCLPMPSRGPLFTRPRSLTRYPPYAISHELNDYLHGLGIASTAHSLRHRFGTDVYAATHDLRVTQELLGHENPSTTTIYVAYSASAARAAVMALGQQEKAAGDPESPLRTAQGELLTEGS